MFVRVDRIISLGQLILNKIKNLLIQINWE